MKLETHSLWDFDYNSDGQPLQAVLDCEAQVIRDIVKLSKSHDMGLGWESAYPVCRRL